MALLYGYLLVAPVILFWLLLTHSVFQKAGEYTPRDRLITILVLLILLIAPLFFEYHVMEIPVIEDVNDLNDIAV